MAAKIHIISRYLPGGEFYASQLDVSTRCCPNSTMHQDYHVAQSDESWSFVNVALNSTSPSRTLYNPHPHMQRTAT